MSIRRIGLTIFDRCCRWYNDSKYCYTKVAAAAIQQENGGGNRISDRK
jgi:hypothetical protein